MHHDSPEVTLTTEAGRVLVRFTDENHAYISTDHDESQADSGLMYRGRSHWFTMHAYRTGTRREDSNSPYSQTGAWARERTITSGEWETIAGESIYSDTYSGTLTDKGHIAVASKVLQALDAYTSTAAGDESLNAASTAHRQNEANERAARIATLRQALDTELVGLSELASEGVTPDEGVRPYPAHLMFRNGRYTEDAE